MNYLGFGCSQPMLSVNDQQNNIYIISGTVVTFKICGDPNADFIIQNVGVGSDVGSDIRSDVSIFYPYDVIDRGKLDSDGKYMSSIPLNQIGTYAFRVGIYCTIADIDYCTKVSNAVIVTILEEGCTPNWQCKQPLDGYEYDANYCGQSERAASRCDSICGGVGCEDNGNGVDNILLKVGTLAVIGAIIFYATKK